MWPLLQNLNYGKGDIKTPPLPHPPTPPTFSNAGPFNDRISATVETPGRGKTGWKRRRQSTTVAAIPSSPSPSSSGGTSAANASIAVASANNAVTTGVPVGPPVVSSSLTRGQRMALSHRHYDIHAAVEVLRRSPLPEAVVLRKMRQIVEARCVILRYKYIYLYIYVYPRRLVIVQLVRYWHQPPCALLLFIIILPCVVAVQ